jgi:glutathione S-transferase
MLLFRSEEHIDRWLDGRPAGATLPVADLAALAHAWWHDRLAPDWRPHTRDDNQAILARLGLDGPFWRLP